MELFFQKQKKIDKPFVNDLGIDCGPEREDEAILMLLLKDDNYSSCTEADMLPCIEGHSRCYHVNAPKTQFAFHGC